MNMPSAAKSVIEGTKIVLFECGNLKKGEVVCIVSDTKTRKVGRMFYNILIRNNFVVRHFCIRPLKAHGEEPGNEAARCMKESNLILGLTRKSMAHTKARYVACKNKARYLSLPEYSINMLKHPSLRVNFRESGKNAMRLMERLASGKALQVSTKAGTDIKLNIRGRRVNFCPGYVNKDIKLGSPPDIEANIAPVENKSNGVIVVDGSIPYPGLGKLKAPVTLTIKNGVIVSIEGTKSYVKKLKDLFRQYGKKSKVLAEFGVGLNKKAKVCGNMLIDEGSYGSFHFGFGSNFTIGGLNAVNFHLDFVLYAKELIIDSQQYKI